MTLYMILYVYYNIYVYNHSMYTVLGNPVVQDKHKHAHLLFFGNTML